MKAQEEAAPARVEKEEGGGESNPSKQAGPSFKVKA